MFSGSVEQAVRELAYAKWEQAGCPAGDGVQFWIEAEQQVCKQSAASCTTTTADAHSKSCEASATSGATEPLKLAKPGSPRRKAS